MRFSLATYCIQTSLLFGLVCFAGSAAANDSDYAENYPGLTYRGGVVDVADSQVRTAVEAYQLVYGRLPHSWSEVRDCGLFDNSLLGYGMELIDPDDASVDFRGDIRLQGSDSQEDGAGLLLYNFYNKGIDVPDRQLPLVEEGYAIRLAAMLQDDTLEAGQREVVQDWIGNEAQLIQFGHVRQLTYAVLVFQAVNGRYPDSLTELVDSGLGPLQQDSINPLTGQAYRYDGSKGDLKYELIDEGMGFKLGHADLTHDVDFEFRY